MEFVMTIVLFGVAIAAGAFVIASIESDKPWARELVRAYSVMDGHPVTTVHTNAGNEPLPFSGRNTEREAANEQPPRLVA